MLLLNQFDWLMIAKLIKKVADIVNFIFLKQFLGISMTIQHKLEPEKGRLFDF